jgi:hypothetical protein
VAGVDPRRRGVLAVLSAGGVGGDVGHDHHRGEEEPGGREDHADGHRPGHHGDQRGGSHERGREGDHLSSWRPGDLQRPEEQASCGAAAREETQGEAGGGRPSVVAEDDGDGDADRARHGAGDDGGEEHPHESRLPQEGPALAPPGGVGPSCPHGAHRRRRDEGQASDHDEHRWHEQGMPRGDHGESEACRCRPREVEQLLDDGVQAEARAQVSIVRGEGAPGDAHGRSQRRCAGAGQAGEDEERGCRSVEQGRRRDGGQRQAEGQDQRGEDGSGTVSVDEHRPCRGEEARRRAVEGDGGAGQGDGARALLDRVEQRQENERVGGTADEGRAEGQGDMGQGEHVEMACCPRGRHGEWLQGKEHAHEGRAGHQ